MRTFDIAAVCLLLLIFYLQVQTQESFFGKPKRSLGFDYSEENIDQILRWHNIRSNFTIQPRNLTYLGYVTPWNPKGYTLSLENAHIFSLISPTWFEAEPSPKTVIEVQTTLIDQVWLSQIRSKNRNIKIVPRVTLNNEVIASFNYSSALEGENAIRSFSEYLLQLCLDNNLDGIVLESLELIRGEYGEYEGTLWIRSLFEHFQDHSLVLVLVLPPIIYSKEGGAHATLSKNTFYGLYDYVTYFSLMTYDFNIHHKSLSTNSPLFWISDNLKYLKVEIYDQRPSKLLIGLNFYGRILSDNLEAITGKQLIQKLEICNRRKSIVKWEQSYEEHVMHLNYGTHSETIAFPTLRSIEQRLNFAESVGAGIAIWELGQGLEYFYDIL